MQFSVQNECGGYLGNKWWCRGVSLEFWFDYKYSSLVSRQICSYVGHSSNFYMLYTFVDD